MTRFVRAGYKLGGLGSHRGWSYRHAAAMLEHYVALDPEMTGGIFGKVQEAEHHRKKPGRDG